MTCALDLPNAKGSRAIGLGGGGTGAAREELRLLIFGKPGFPESSTQSLSSLVFPDSAWLCVSHPDLPQMQKGSCLGPLNPGAQKSNKTLLDTGIHPPAPHSLNACSVQAPVYMAGYNPEPVPGSSQPRK